MYQLFGGEVPRADLQLLLHDVPFLGPKRAREASPPHEKHSGQQF